MRSSRTTAYDLFTRRAAADAGARIRRVARERLKDGLLKLVLRQAWTELSVSLRGRLHFRERENARAVRAYCAMTAAEFSDINARQRWANWRTIPRNLHGRLSTLPCRALDLCSGVGDSTEVLACYLPGGSEILGLEFNPVFVRAARGRSYRGGGGEAVDVRFRVQSVLETFRDASGERLADASLDLVNCSGALAINFAEAEIEALAAEISRVLKAGGLAAIDAPATGPGQERLVRIFGRRRFEALGSAQSCFLDRFSQICLRRRRP